MNGLLFITSHRHEEEFSLYAEFLKRTQTIKDWDIIFHVNNLGVDLNTIKESFAKIPNQNKHLIVTDRNCDPYGPMRALSDFYPQLQKYDNVIHSHVDVFIVDENKLLDVVNSNLDKAFLVNHSFETIKDWMSTDLFIFRPKLLTQDIFKDWVNHYGQPLGSPNGPCCEQFVYRQVKKYDIPHEYIKRFDTDHWDPRRVCMWGCYHEHDLSKAWNCLNGL